MKRLGLALVVTLVASCATVPAEPGPVFDAYVAAYANGDTERLWELSTPEARLDARRVKAELLAALSDPDAAKRVLVEGQFGVTASDVELMDDRRFFGWALQVIRRRLGVAFVQQTVGGMQRVRFETDGDRLYVVYRERSGVESRMPLKRVEQSWRVDASPFPQPAPAAVEKPPSEDVAPDPPAAD